MRVLVNALSATNLSGRHVLLGHLARLSVWTRGTHEYVVLHHRGNQDLRRDLGPNVGWVEGPRCNATWSGRTAWERVGLNRVARLHGADCVFTVSGIAVPGMELPQIVFAQNPWCLVSGLKRGPAGQLKAWLQRRAYARTMRDAAVMVFNSEYMRSAYRQNAGHEEKTSAVVYQGIADVTHAAAAARAGEQRRIRQMVTVSVMARHKGIETVLRALAEVRARGHREMALKLAGPWSDRVYEKEMRRLAGDLGLSEAVEFLGYVSRERLHELYAESTLFCLMSRCESFGLPAIEAQAFGTPVVSSNCCAIPEICGAGGVYEAPDDWRAVAVRIWELCESEPVWGRLSQSARENARRFRWDECSRPLHGMFTRSDWMRRGVIPEPTHA